jgi:hypothetical protein
MTVLLVDFLVDNFLVVGAFEVLALGTFAMGEDAVLDDISIIGE